MTSTSEIAETKILSPFFSSVVMIRRAVGESCFESERYQITAWVSRTTAIRKHPAGSCPTFRDGLRRCLLHSLSHPVSTKDLTGFAEVRSRIFPAVDLQRQEPPGNESVHHSRVLRGTARNFVGNIRRRNLGGLALRSAQAACGQVSGVQPAQERSTQTWQQKRQDRCPQTGRPVASQ